MLPQRRYGAALDLGCGLGLFTEHFAQRVGWVLGVDISEVALRLAASRTRRLRNISFQVGDTSESDPFLDGRFDLVVAADVMYYLSGLLDDGRLDRIANRISRLLMDEGLLMITNHTSLRKM